MAAANDKSPLLGRVFSKDVWISEKRGVSRARDAKTGRLLGEGAGTVRSKTAAFAGRFKR
jgi:hypothetical protein